MAQAGTFLNSSIGKKQLMAVTGLMWCGFVLTHMAGNLLMLVGADTYNSYGDKIVNNPFILLAEGGLVVTLLMHIVSAARVVLGNRAAKPDKYAVSAQGKGKASLASRTMALSGTLILAFLVLHLITFKFGAHYSATVHGAEIRDLYLLAKEVFANSLYVGWYAFSMVVLSLHLQHALFSSLQTLGFVPAALEKKLRCLSVGFGVVVSLGFMVGPLYFYFLGGV
jgi:succinate dehydrogenase / fumarate reductase cytochrome b subunit